MDAKRSWASVGVRIAIALAAGLVVGGAGPIGQPFQGQVGLPICHSRVDCGPQVIGGVRITFTGWACTTGFVARDTETGTLVVLTAGHCLAGSGLSALWTHHGVAIGRAALEAFHPGSNADVGAIDLIDSQASDEV